MLVLGEKEGKEESVKHFGIGLWGNLYSIFGLSNRF